MVECYFCKVDMPVRFWLGPQLLAYRITSAQTRFAVFACVIRRCASIASQWTFWESNSGWGRENGSFPVAEVVETAGFQSAAKRAAR